MKSCVKLSAVAIALSFLVFALMRATNLNQTSFARCSVQESEVESNDATLLDAITSVSGDLEVFPFDVLIPSALDPCGVDLRDLNATRVELTFERFLPFCRWKNAALAATSGQIRRCVDNYAMASPRAQALILASIYVFTMQNHPALARSYNERNQSFREISKLGYAANPEQSDVSQEEWRAWFSLLAQAQDSNEIAFPAIPTTKDMTTLWELDFRWNAMRFVCYHDFALHPYSRLGYSYDDPQAFCSMDLYEGNFQNPTRAYFEDTSVFILMYSLINTVETLATTEFARDFRKYYGPPRFMPSPTERELLYNDVFHSIYTISGGIKKFLTKRLVIPTDYYYYNIADYSLHESGSGVPADEVKFQAKAMREFFRVHLVPQDYDRQTQTLNAVNTSDSDLTLGQIAFRLTSALNTASENE